jgi:glycine/serine hydroxymethyltransferase
VRGAAILAERLSQQDVKDAGISVRSGGTDVHLVLVDLRDAAIDGKQAEDLLHEIHITVNRNAVPNDPRPPMVTSGLRIGTRRSRPAASATPSSPRSPTSSRSRCCRTPTSSRCARAWPP